jgi:thioredoxin reductase
VVIVGGGPSGLSAALALGRANKDVLVCDAGPRRNAAAVHMHNFVTRDGIAPEAFRAEARAQLAAYPKVVCVATGVAEIAGEKGDFRVALASGATVHARRLLLATGLIDELPAIEACWGQSVVQCPYCHGWESKGQAWGYLATAAHADHLAMFALQLRGWTSDVTVFTNHAFVPARRDAGSGNAFSPPAATLAAFEAARVKVVTAPIARLLPAGDGRLEAIELADGSRVPCALLFAHPPQRQVPLVTALGVALDGDGFVAVDPMRRETSVPGIYAAGDLTTRMQAAIAAAAAGMQAAAALNAELTLERVLAGAL